MSGYNNWYTDNRQNKQIEQLREDLEYASSETSNLRSRMSQLQGTLEAKVNRLTAAFDAFVELSDIRHDLIGFANAAEVRRYAGQLLAALVNGATPPPAPPQVDGYWLCPALDAVKKLYAGADPAAELTEATARDERRTSIFLCLALAALGRRHEVREDWLRVAFGKPAADGTVTRLQRALWLTAARGGFGDTGPAILAELLGPAPDKNWALTLAAAGSKDRSWLDDKNIVDQLIAADQLSRLRKAVERILTDRSVLEPAPSTLAAEESAAEPVPAETSASKDKGKDKGKGRNAAKGKDEADDPGSPDAMVDMLRMVIAEGSAPERDLIARIGALRAKLDGGEAAAFAIEDEAGPITELLTDDLRGANGPHVAAFAVRHVAPAVLAEAGTLRDRASADAPPDLVLNSSGQKVTVTPQGVDAGSMSEAEHRLRTVNEVKPSGGWIAGIVLMVIGVVGGLGLSIAIHWGWIFPALFAIGLGAYLALNDRARVRNEQADLDDRITRLKSTADSMAAQLATYTQAHPARTQTATTDYTTLEKTLT